MIEFQAEEISTFLFLMQFAIRRFKTKKITHFYSFADDLATMNFFRFWCLVSVTHNSLPK
jgi:hypothetical protein